MVSTEQRWTTRRNNNNDLSNVDEVEEQQQVPANQLSRTQQDVETVVMDIVSNVQSQVGLKRILRIFEFESIKFLTNEYF